MNKQKTKKGNGIEWCDYTWNPVTGCGNECEYCYARRIANRFRDKSNLTYVDGVKPGHLSHIPFPYGFLPTLHPERLNEPQKVKKPSKIFVVSMGDLFGDWVPDEWIEQVFESCRKAPWHTYFFLTKNPERYSKLNDNRILPKDDNFWYGITITQVDNHRLIDYIPDYYGKPEPVHRNTFISFEPLLDRHAAQLVKYYSHCFKWVIVGAQTGLKAIKPQSEWVQSIIGQCRQANIPIFLKSNLNWPDKIQEWPEELR